MAAHRVPDFKRVGGRTCLDFVNTVGGRVHGASAPAGYEIREERLQDLRDLAAWARGAGLPVGSGDALPGPEAAAAQLERAIGMREALYRIVRATIRGEPAAAADLDTLSAELRRSRRFERLVARPDGGFGLRREDGARFPESVLGQLAEAATRLLTGADLALVKQCPGEECGWLFADESRNRRRRWCDMKDCGNLAKVRRFRSRSR